MQSQDRRSAQDSVNSLFEDEAPSPIIDVDNEARGRDTRRAPSLIEFVRRLKSVSEYEEILKEWNEAADLTKFPERRNKDQSSSHAPSWFKLLFTRDLADFRQLMRGDAKQEARKNEETGALEIHTFAEGVFTSIMNRVSYLHAWFPLFAGFAVVGMLLANRFIDWPFVKRVIGEERVTKLFERASENLLSLEQGVAVIICIVLCGGFVAFAMKLAWDQKSKRPALLTAVPIAASFFHSSQKDNRASSIRAALKGVGTAVTFWLGSVVSILAGAVAFFGGSFLCLGRDPTFSVMIGGLGLFVVLLTIVHFRDYTIQDHTNSSLLRDLRNSLKRRFDENERLIDRYLERSRVDDREEASLAIIKQRLISRRHWEFHYWAHLSYQFLRFDAFDLGTAESWRLQRRFLWVFILLLAYVTFATPSNSEQFELIRDVTGFFGWFLATSFFFTGLGHFIAGKTIDGCEAAIVAHPEEQHLRTLSIDAGNCPRWKPRWEDDDLFKYAKRHLEMMKRVDNVILNRK